LVGHQSEHSRLGAERLKTEETRLILSSRTGLELYLLVLT